MPLTRLQSLVLRTLADKRSPDSYIAGGAGPCEDMQLEWVADSNFRVFPAQRDELFGNVLHPVDLAINKASAAADRREPRDVVGLVTIHETIFPLGAVVCAADDVGFVFLDGERAVQPDLREIAGYQRRAGSRRGIWPSSAQISRAMLDKYWKD